MIRPLMLTIALLAALPARADALLDQIVAGARAAAPMGFQRTAVIEPGDPKQPTVKRVDRFDPAAPEPKRWTLVSVNGAPPTAKDQDQYRKQVTSVPAPGYYRIATFLSAGAVRAAHAQGHAVYRVAKLPAGSVKANGFDLSSRLSAELMVDQRGARPTVSRVRIYLAKPIRIMVVAKLDRFEAVSDYAAGGSGTPVLVAQSSDVTGSNPLNGNGTVRQRFSFRPL